LGGTKYSEEGIDVGNIFTEGLNSMAYIIVASPVILYFYPKRKILILTIITFVALLVLIQLKRISIIATIFGLLVFVFFYKEKSKVITGLATATLIFIAIFPLYSDIFEAQLEKRESKMQVQNLENEGRSMEFFWIISDLNESTSKFLFGHNMFNSSGNYNNPDSKERQIHNDYNALLHGSGIFGLIYFISLQFYLYYLYLKVKRKINNKLFHLKQENKLLDLFKYLFPAFFFMGFLIMMSGGMYAYLFNSIRYITLGSVLGYMYHENHKISKL
jgi:Ca2+/Na+ antiporter